MNQINENLGVNDPEHNRQLKGLVEEAIMEMSKGDIEEMYDLAYEMCVLADKLSIIAERSVIERDQKLFKDAKNSARRCFNAVGNYKSISVK